MMLCCIMIPRCSVYTLRYTRFKGDILNIYFIVYCIGIHNDTCYPSRAYINFKRNLLLGLMEYVSCLDIFFSRYKKNKNRYYHKTFNKIKPSRAEKF